MTKSNRLSGAFSALLLLVLLLTTLSVVPPMVLATSADGSPNTFYLPLLTNASAARSNPVLSNASPTPAPATPAPTAALPTATAALPTATTAPQTTATATPVSKPSGWLATLNAYRAMSGLAPVTENAGWSAGGVLHAQYVVKADTLTHYEDPNSQYYTQAGYDAGRNGNVMAGSSTAYADESAVSLWMGGPFHGLGMIDPKLTQSGFGSYREANGSIGMAATLDVLRGRSASLPAGATFPVLWPGNGATTPLASFDGSEYPDPLAGCAGYTASASKPTGTPIYLELGAGNVTPSVSAYSLMQGATLVESCAFDETNYVNTKPTEVDAQSLGRTILHMRSAIVIMPKLPLVRGATYTASVTTNGTTYTWSFTVSATAQ